MNIFTLDPIWSSLCTGIFSDSFGLIIFALFDPPIALTAAPLLLPTPFARPTPASATADPTSVSKQTKPSTEAAKPASLPNDPVAPAKTGDPGKNTPAQSPGIGSADPAGSANLPENPVAPSKNEDDAPLDPSTDPPLDPPSDPPSNPSSDSRSHPKTPSVDKDPPSPNALNSMPDDSQQSPTDPKVPIIPVSQSVKDSQGRAQGLGAIIYNAFGKTESDGSSAILLAPQSIFVAGAQTFTANPTGAKVNGAAVTPDGIAQTVDGTIISLDKAGVLAIGSSTVSLTNPSATPVLAVAGQTFSPNPLAFSVAGIIVSAGGPAVTVDGTAISLDHSGALAIGSTTISLATPPSKPFATKAFTVAGQTFTPNPSAFSIAGTTISADGPAVTIGGIDLSSPLYNSVGQAYTVAGQVFTPNPSAFSVAGMTISAGGPAATIGGTIISLEPSNTLVVGSSTIPLLPQTAFQSDINIDGFDVIAQSSFAVVDGVTVSAATAGATVSGKTVSLEAGCATLDIGTGRFALPTPAAAANGSVNVQAFLVGQSKGLEVPLYLVGGVCGALMLLMWHY